MIRANDNAQPDDDGGRGRTPLVGGSNPRREINLLKRAIGAGWRITASKRREIEAELIKVMQTTEDDRCRVAAATALAKMHETNIKQLEVLDKMDRLDHDKATDIVSEPKRLALEFDDRS